MLWLFLTVLAICIILRMIAKTNHIKAETDRINAETEFYRRKQYEQLKPKIDLSAAIDDAAKQYERKGPQ